MAPQLRGPASLGCVGPAAVRPPQLCGPRYFIAGRSAHSASPSRDLPVAGLFVSFSPFSVLGFFVVFEGLYVLWIGGGYVKRVLGYSVVLWTLWKDEILGNRPLGRCWGPPAFL